MLISFEVENWKSYREYTKLNFVAGRTRSHLETLSEVDGYRGLKVLPISGIWGGNAGGKTNLLEALSFVKNFVVIGANQSERIAVEPFRPSVDQQPTYMGITFLVDGRIYKLEFLITAQMVLEESLFWLKHNKDWNPIYTRTTSKDGEVHVEFETSASPELVDYTKYMSQLQACVFGTGQYRLFITNTVNQRVPVFAPLINWFNRTLRYAGAGTNYTRFSTMMTDDRYCKMISTILHALDTGVDQVSLEEVDTRSVFESIPQQLLEELDQQKDAVVQIEGRKHYDTPSEVLLITQSEGNRTVRRVQTYRKNAYGEMVPFGLSYESSGTRRLLEILPIFTDLWAGEGECVWVLDEIDKEFHTDLTCALVQHFLDSTGQNSRRQMLFTTHDLMLMDQDILRVDEINVVQREIDGTSTLTPLHRFDGLRNDRDLRKSYLDGRFGGIPKLEPIGLGDLEEVEYGQAAK